MCERFGGQGLANTELTALPGGAAHFNSRTVCVTKGLDDGQAEACAAGAVLAGARAVDTEESFEHMRQGFGGNSDAVVDDIQDRTALVAGGLEPDPAAVGGVLDGVVEQVHYHLLEPGLIALDHDPLGAITHHGDMFVLGEQIHLVGGRGHELGQIEAHPF